jgi:hypothetical protein
MSRVFVDPKNLSRVERAIKLCNDGETNQAINLIYEWVKTDKMSKNEFTSFLEKFKQ